MNRLIKTRKNGKSSAPSQSLIKRIVRDYELYLFLLPALAYFVIFNYGPMYGLKIAFQNNLTHQWVGLKYFIQFFKSPTIGQLLGNTLAITLYLFAVSFPIAIILALMLNEMKHRRYKKVIQAVTYAPYFISAVVMVGIVTLFLNPDYGIVNFALKALGRQPIDFIIKASMFRNIYVWSDVWQNAGYSAVIYLAALSSVDMELHEAAVMDGASRLKRVWHINLPCIVPTIMILLIMSVGQIMNVGIDKIFLFQNNGNLGVSEIIDTFVYKQGLASQAPNPGFAAAVGMFNNTVNLVLLLIVNFISRRVSDTSLF
ncbi:MAG: ABC transporter permease subunit [Defluviitaleaceae bacterium]|nr:ABC transporter permease subunit [Defluviitaleaceae bacterium]